MRLDAGSGFKTANQFPRVAAQLAQMIADNGVGAFKSKPAQFFSHPNGGDLGIAFQKLNDIVLEGIQQTLPWFALLGRRTGPVLFMLGDDLGDCLTVDTERLRDPAMRGSTVEHANDFVACRFVHRFHTPSPCRR